MDLRTSNRGDENLARRLSSALVSCTEQDQANMPADFVSASDHCPIVLDLVDVDWD